MKIAECEGLVLFFFGGGEVCIFCWIVFCLLCKKATGFFLLICFKLHHFQLNCDAMKHQPTSDQCCHCIACLSTSHHGEQHYTNISEKSLQNNHQLIWDFELSKTFGHTKAHCSCAFASSDVSSIWGCSCTGHTRTMWEIEREEQRKGRNIAMPGRTFPPGK